MKNILSFVKLFESKNEVIVVVSGVRFEETPSLSFITKDLDYFITNGIYISSFTEEGMHDYQLTINCPNKNVADYLERVITENDLGEVVDVF